MYGGSRGISVNVMRNKKTEIADYESSQQGEGGYYSELFRLEKIQIKITEQGFFIDGK